MTCLDSSGENVRGFSQYTSLLCFIASTHMYACQWSGVAMTTASIEGSFMTSRKSATARQTPFSPYASSTISAAQLRRSSSQSQQATILYWSHPLQYGSLPSIWAKSALRIWMPQPITPTRIFSPGLRSRRPVFEVAQPASAMAAAEPNRKFLRFSFILV